MLVVDGRCRTSEIVDSVYLDIEWKRNVVAYLLEVRAPQQLLDVFAPAGVEIVDADNLIPSIEQSLTQVRAEKAGSARH